ncbi:MAG: arsenical resistance protein ArsH [Kangiellaceae bacterium]|nr:arsenical resistance protein ArsH [Kangiellaceae bacterium]
MKHHTLFPNHSLDETLIQMNRNKSLDHAPRVLILYGSIREGSYSRMLAMEAKRILQSYGAEVRVFDPSELPLFDNVQVEHPKVVELRELAKWSEAMVWSSPELHGNYTSVFKNQIDWIPLSEGSIRPTQGKVLAVMQVTGGSQSFNVVNNLRILGRWMRMFTIPNQSSVPKAYQEFNKDGTMKDSPLKDRVVDVMEELFRMTLVLREKSEWLSNRFSENKTTQNPINETTRCNNILADSGVMQANC